jgi:hypothetical protein
VDLSLTAAQPIARRRLGARWPLLLLLLLGALTTAPYVYAAWTTPADRVYTGLMLDAPDTLQYFSWLRDHRAALLISNRMTAQPNEPALFNLLWLLLAQVQRLTGWSNAAIFQLLRLVGGVSFAAALWWFYGLIAGNTRARGWAWALAMCGGGLGVIWVLRKYLLGREIDHPLDVYVAEPNTVLSLLGYPHFLVAGALIVATLGAAFTAARNGWRWWLVAAGCALLLALQHAYDLLTVYATLGGWIALLALKRRAIPWAIVRGALAVGLISFPPAGYFAWLTSRDPLWRAVLSQFSNADVWTPSPPHLLLLLGLPLILTIVCWDWLPQRGWLAERSDGELLVRVWALSGLALIYLPVSFQIHLLNPWQVPLALLAVWGVERRIQPWAERRRWAAARWLLPLTLLLALPTNLYLISWRFVELARHDQPYFLSLDQAAALDRLAATATRQDVVLSELALGQFVAAQTDARAVLAHWAQTVAFYQTSDDVERALDPASPSATRQALLATYGVSYVLAPRPLNDPALSQVWTTPTLTLYMVRRGH